MKQRLGPKLRLIVIATMLVLILTPVYKSMQVVFAIKSVIGTEAEIRTDEESLSFVADTTPSAQIPIYHTKNLMLTKLIANVPMKQTTATSKNTYTVVFLAPASDIMPDTAREAVVTAMNAWPDNPPENNRFYLVGLRWENDWALASLTSANLETPLDPAQHTHLSIDNMIALVLVKTENGWQAAIDVDDEVDSLLAYVPYTELDQRSREAIFPSLDQIRNPLSLDQQYFDYKFPWPSGYAWRTTTGIWHGTGGEVGNNALDFDINLPYTNSDILAAAPGVVTHMCEGTNDQYYLRIVTDGTTERFGYLHLDGATVRDEGITQGTHVNLGQKLGRMWEGTGSDNCGISNGTHIHLHFPDKPFTIDGVTFTETNTHYGEELYSSQLPIDTTAPSIAITAPDSSTWYSSDQTISWFVSDVGSGAAYFKWEWDDDTPDNQVNSNSGSTTISAAGEGQHMLYIQAWDNANNTSGVIASGWFGYDVSAPSNPNNVNPGCTASNDTWQNTCTNPAFTWSGAVDSGSGVQDYHIYWGMDPSGTPTTWRTTPDFDPPAITTSGNVTTYYLRITTRDNLGHETNPTTLFILRYDNSTPMGTPLINGGAETVYNTNVLIQPQGSDTGSGIVQIHLSNDGVYWETIASHTTVSWALLGLNRAWNPLWIQLEDGAGNLSSIYKRQVCLDLYPAHPSSNSFRLWHAGPTAAGGTLNSVNFQLIQSVGQTNNLMVLSSNTYQLQSGFSLSPSILPDNLLFTPFICEQTVYLPVVMRP